MTKKFELWLSEKFSQGAAQKSKRFYWLVTNTPYSTSFVWVWLERGVTVQFVYSVIRWQSVGTRTKEFSSPHNGVTYTNVLKKSRRMVWILVTMFTFCWRNPRNLLVGEDSCHLMINLFCEMWGKFVCMRYISTKVDRIFNGSNLFYPLHELP